LSVNVIVVSNIRNIAIVGIAHNSAHNSGVPEHRTTPHNTQQLDSRLKDGCE